MAPVKVCGSPNKELWPGQVCKSRTQTIDSSDEKHVNQIWHPLGIIFKTRDPLLH